MSISIVILIIVVVVVGLVLLRRGTVQRLSPDGQVIAALLKAGSDLSKPHPVEFFLYFPTTQAAEKIGGTLREEGFEVLVQPAAQGPHFLVKATRSMVPYESDLLSLREHLGALAEKAGGKYDGWGTSVVE